MIAGSFLPCCIHSRDEMINYLWAGFGAEYPFSTAVFTDDRAYSRFCLDFFHPTNLGFKIPPVMVGANDIIAYIHGDKCMPTTCKLAPAANVDRLLCFPVFSGDNPGFSSIAVSSPTLPHAGYSSFASLNYKFF
jgi:hypothetical protein